jgi:hypothetical protein
VFGIRRIEQTTYENVAVRLHQARAEIEARARLRSVSYGVATEF